VGTAKEGKSPQGKGAGSSQTRSLVFPQEMQRGTWGRGSEGKKGRIRQNERNTPRDREDVCRREDTVGAEKDEEKKREKKTWEGGKSMKKPRAFTYTMSRREKTMTSNGGPERKKKSTGTQQEPWTLEKNN